jgi:hypothetical protein
VTTVSPVAGVADRGLAFLVDLSMRTMLCIGRCSARVPPNSSRKRSSVGIDHHAGVHVEHQVRNLGEAPQGTGGHALRVQLVDPAALRKVTL